MDKIRPSNTTNLYRWECPNCKYIVGFLPSDPELSCPRCSKSKAKDFISIGYGPLEEDKNG